LQIGLSHPISGPLDLVSQAAHVKQIYIACPLLPRRASKSITKGLMATCQDGHGETLGYPS
jgi:hypothetical protein